MLAICERVLKICLILLMYYHKVKSETETTLEIDAVTINITESSTMELNTTTLEIDAVTLNITESSIMELNTTQETASANSTDENEDLSIKTNSSDADVILETEDFSNTTDASTPEDFGTVIESDVDDNTTTTFEEATTEEGSTTNINGTNRSTSNEPQGQQLSTKDALKDIAYYLKAYKFNEYDRRYETNSETAPMAYFKEFPRPPLRSLHWEVRKYCEPSFSGCVDYLRKRIRYVSLKRVDDTAVVMQEQNWTLANHGDQIKQIDDECKKLRRVGDVVAEPFEGPLERFQWRVTASYYMCWYTMQQIPELQHLSDHCDNFADCLDENIGSSNKDVRANDSDPYACAQYSFCPNPCCPMKHLTQLEDCWDSKENPCFLENPPGQRECAMNRSSNMEFRDIVLNRWNVTCRCPTGYEWNSRFGMCIDVDECARGRHNCDGRWQACLNLPGSFRCACKWGHIWSPTKEQCIPSKALQHLKLSHKKNGEDTDENSNSLIRRITKIFRKSAANTSRPDKIAWVLCVVVFVPKYGLCLQAPSVLSCIAS